MDKIDEKVVETLEQNSALKQMMKNEIIKNLISIAVIVIIGLLLLKLSKKIINKLINTEKTGKFTNKAKLATISKIIYSIIRVVIIFIITTIILDTMGINTSSLIATAGIGGLAIAFGSQTIIQDFIKGIFIVIDDKIRVGDWVVTAGAEGEVEELNLRTTKIRDFNGALHIIPNSQINQVQNYNRGSCKSEVLFRVAYDVSLKEVKEIIKKVSEKIIQSEYKNKIIDNFEFFEIKEFGERSYQVRMIAVCKQGYQWAVSRKARELIKEELEERDIKVSIMEYRRDEKIQSR